ncbi:MAG: DEAD/DEAH box helicase [Alphaproteobacteria bacterium]|nr:DEAD/DEAH box helicase [Alphaproteobacteria bacterium]MBV8549411.1 DEAD/DEAH box helicase [Alphaproteobacteria bacterium]
MEIERVKQNKVTSFADLGLSEDILKAIQDVGYTTPTPIQEQAIPYVLQMRDVLGCAQTGTGKTAGFVLPMLEILGSGRARARMPRSLILEPTRELAAQVAENFQIYGKYHKLSMALLIGGETMDEQIRNLDRGVDVLIATPGRMIDLYERGKVMLNDIKIFVIDEADRMLDMGFIPDVEKIAGLLPSMRQTLFFSATMPPEIRKLADRFLSNPKSVTVAPPSSTSENVKQIFVNLPQNNDWLKREALRTLLRREQVQNAFIFCNRKRDVATLQKSLSKHGFNAGPLHGDMTQSERTATLEKFKKNEISLLVCSDVAARGLDVEALSHVFNFDVPFHAEDYVHRIGRTGRAGRSGTAYTLVTPDDDKLVNAVEELIKKKIDRESIGDLPEPRPNVGHSHRRVSAHRGPRRDHHRQRNDRPSEKRNQGDAPSRDFKETQPAPATTRVAQPPTQRSNSTQDRFADDMPAFLRRPVTTGSR